MSSISEQNADRIDRIEEMVDRLLEQREKTRQNAEQLDKLAGRIERLSGGSGETQQLGRSGDNSEKSALELEQEVFSL